MSDECVTVVQGKECKYLTFLCPSCKLRHTIPVLETKVGWYVQRSEAYSYGSFTGRDADNNYLDIPCLPFTFWYWNGDLVNPIVGPRCIVMPPHHCHTWIVDGYENGYHQYPLAKVKDWPQPLKPK